MSTDIDTPRKSIIWDEIASQEAAIENLSQTVNFVEDRLGTILGPPQTSDETESSPIAEASALTNKIKSSSRFIQSINERIKIILDRLEL